MGELKKSKYVLLLDSSEYNSWIPPYEQIITWEGVLKHNPKVFQGHIKVISRSNGQKILKIFTFYQFQACWWCSYVLEKTDDDTFLVGYHFNIQFCRLQFRQFSRLQQLSFVSFVEYKSSVSSVSSITRTHYRKPVLLVSFRQFCFVSSITASHKACIKHQTSDRLKFDLIGY